MVAPLSSSVLPVMAQMAAPGERRGRARSGRSARPDTSGRRRVRRSVGRGGAHQGTDHRATDGEPERSVWSTGPLSGVRPVAPYGWWNVTGLVPDGLMPFQRPRIRPPRIRGDRAPPGRHARSLRTARPRRSRPPLQPAPRRPAPLVVTAPATAAAAHLGPAGLHRGAARLRGPSSWPGSLGAGLLLAGRYHEPVHRTAAGPTTGPRSSTSGPDGPGGRRRPAAQRPAGRHGRHTRASTCRVAATADFAAGQATRILAWAIFAQVHRRRHQRRPADRASADIPAQRPRAGLRDRRLDPGRRGRGAGRPGLRGRDAPPGGPGAGGRSPWWRWSCAARTTSTTGPAWWGSWCGRRSFTGSTSGSAA